MEIGTLKTDDVFEVLKKSGYFFHPKESSINTHQNTERKQIDGIAHLKGVQFTARAGKDSTLERVLPHKEISFDHEPLIGSLFWQSRAQASATKYHQVSCFFHMYWNYCQSDVSNASSRNILEKKIHQPMLCHENKRILKRGFFR